jgi:hypothetical protein
LCENEGISFQSISITQNMADKIRISHREYPG